MCVPFIKKSRLFIKGTHIANCFFLSTDLSFSSYFANPEFGVEFSIEEQQSDQPTTRLESKVDDIEIIREFIRVSYRYLIGREIPNAIVSIV